mmetsp:Transcript_154982/g.496732  ORF Transcript_154982/g.496732 Transcript_154982/m.496732 type:complete len:277 (-) Transcript_154982:190-1020(-)
MPASEVSNGGQRRPNLPSGPYRARRELPDRPRERPASRPSDIGDEQTGASDQAAQGETQERPQDRDVADVGHEEGQSGQRAADQEHSNLRHQHERAGQIFPGEELQRRPLPHGTVFVLERCHRGKEPWHVADQEAKPGQHNAWHGSNRPRQCEGATRCTDTRQGTDRHQDADAVVHAVVHGRLSPIHASLGPRKHPHVVLREGAEHHAGDSCAAQRAAPVAPAAETVASADGARATAAEHRVAAGQEHDLDRLGKADNAEALLLRGGRRRCCVRCL